MASEVWAHIVERTKGIATRAHMTEGNTVVVFERRGNKVVEADKYPIPGRRISCSDDLSLSPSHYSQARKMAGGILPRKKVPTR